MDPEVIMRRSLFLVVFLAGCSGDPNQAQLVPVNGKVMLDNQPLANAVVEFHPTGSTKGIGAVGRTDGSGAYTLTTPKGGKGIMPGEYKVTVSKLVDPQTGADAVLDPSKPPIEQPATKELLPPHYSNPTLSTLTKNVPPGGGSIDISLKKK